MLRYSVLVKGSSDEDRSCKEKEGSSRNDIGGREELHLKEESQMRHMVARDSSGKPRS